MIAGEGWKKLNQDARQIIKAELGHGPDRDDVVVLWESDCGRFEILNRGAIATIG
jgi:hypothetical protein